MLKAIRRVTRLLLISLVLLPAVLPVSIAAAEADVSARARLNPQPVAAGVSAGFLHSAMINYDQKLYLWGDNAYGQLGLQSDDYYDSPQLLELPGDVAAVSLGAYHSLVLLTDGTVWSFGRNAYGQLGTGGTANAGTPARVEGLPQIQAVAAGFMHSLALGADGSVWAWGNNTDKQVGDIPDEPILGNDGEVLGSRCLKPVRVISSGADAIAAGGQHSLYLSKEGQVFAWGDNSKGQLGDGTNQTHARPAIVSGLEDVTGIVAGYQHSLAIVRMPDRDALMVWGDDSLGQLGLGSGLSADSFRTMPVRVDLTGDDNPLNDRLIRLAAGYAQTAAVVPAIDDEGHIDSSRHQLLVWGSNSNGQLALGASTSQNRPVAVSSSQNGWSGSDFLPFDALALGGSHLLALSSTGLLGAAGRGDRGQLGNLSVLDRNGLIPVPIPDAVRPAWMTGASISMEWDLDGQLIIRWPAAQDNKSVAGYDVLLTAPDGAAVRYLVGSNLVLAIQDVDPESALEIKVMAYDEESNSSADRALSQLVGYTLPQSADPGLTPADFFQMPAESVFQVDSAHTNWRPDPQSLIRPLDTPWVTSDPYDSSGVVRPADWSGFRSTTVVSLILVCLMAIDVFLHRKKTSIFKQSRKKHAG